MELRGTTVAFKYNDLEGFQPIIDNYGSNLAAVIMEPCRNRDPDPSFLQSVKKATRRSGAILILDEITVGWRVNYGGAHLKFNIELDIAIFVKALGNGSPIGAVIGSKGGYGRSQ